MFSSTYPQVFDVDEEPEVITIKGMPSEHIFSQRLHEPSDAPDMVFLVSKWYIDHVM